MKVVIFAKEKGGTGEAALALSKIEGVTQVFMVTGKDDIIALINVLSEDELKWLRQRMLDEPTIKSFEIKRVEWEWTR